MTVHAARHQVRAADRGSVDVIPSCASTQIAREVPADGAQITLMTSWRSVADLPASGLNLRPEKSVGFANVGRTVSPSLTLGAEPSMLLHTEPMVITGHESMPRVCSDLTHVATERMSSSAQSSRTPLGPGIFFRLDRCETLKNLYAILQMAHAQVVRCSCTCCAPLDEAGGGDEAPGEHAHLALLLLVVLQLDHQLRPCASGRGPSQQTALQVTKARRPSILRR